MANWDVFYSDRLEIARGLTTTEIREGLARGEIRDDDLVRPAGKTEPWIPILERNDLLQAFEETRTPPPTPLPVPSPTPTPAYLESPSQDDLSRILDDRSEPDFPGIAGISDHDIGYGFADSGEVPQVFDESRSVAAPISTISESSVAPEASSTAIPSVDDISEDGLGNMDPTFDDWAAVEPIRVEGEVIHTAIPLTPLAPYLGDPVDTNFSPGAAPILVPPPDPPPSSPGDHSLFEFEGEGLALSEFPIVDNELDEEDAEQEVEDKDEDDEEEDFDPQEEDEAAAEFTLARGGPQTVEELDLAAMVDVAFQLVLFFLVTATTVLFKTLELPKPSADKPPEAAAQGRNRSFDELMEDNILVEVAADGALKIDREPISGELSLELLANKLREARAKVRRNAMLLSADFSTTHRHAVLAFDAANEVGLQIKIAKPVETATPAKPPPAPRKAATARAGG